MNAPSAEALRDRTVRWVAAALFLIAACYFYRRTTAYSPPSQVAMSGLALEKLDGSRLPPQTTQGKAVLVNFWAPWCGPCRAEMPWLERLQAEHPEIAVIGVEDDTEVYQSAEILAMQTGIDYPLVRATQPVLAVFGHVVELPTTLYISRSGKVLHTVNGVVPEAMMMRYAQDAIAAE